MPPLRIYVASSWRNKYQPEVVSALKEAGHDVYDFKAPEPGDNGFHWSEIDSNWQAWSVEQYAKALEHPIAQRGFKLDLSAVLRSNLCVLVLPSGRSASWEYGYHCGRTGRAGIVHMPERCEPELMYSGSVFTDSIASLLLAVLDFQQEVDRRPAVLLSDRRLQELMGIDAQLDNDEVSRYFRSMGYSVTWDFSGRLNRKWYEVMDGQNLVCQIDFGVPLADILEDLPLLAEGKLGTSKSDYVISSEDDEALKTLGQRILAGRGEAKP
jgi:hypothetical protein